MADRNVNIDINVQTTSLDQATQSINKLNTATQNLQTTSQNFGKGVQIIYDSNGKAIDVVTESTKRLAAQSRDLVNAMARLTQEGKTNTDEFTLLQRKHLELATTIDKTKATSKDLFGTFSALPGPLGDFSAKLQGAVEVMKLLSNTSLASLKTQFGELGNVVSSFLGINKNDNQSKTQQAQSNVVQNVTGVNEETTEALKEQNAQQEKLNENLEKTHENLGNNAAAAKLYADEQKSDGVNLAEIKNGSKKADDALKNLNEKFSAQKDIITDDKGKITDILISYVTAKDDLALLTTTQVENIAKSKTQINTYKELEQASIKTGGFFNSLNAGLQTIGLSAEGAATGIGILEAALTALGIGLVIAAIVGLYEVTVKYGKELLGIKEETTENKAATDSWTESLKNQEHALDVEIKAIDAGNKMLQTRKQIAGETEEDVLQIQKKGGKDRLEALEAEQTALYNQQDEFNKKYSLSSFEYQQMKEKKDVLGMLSYRSKMKEQESMTAEQRLKINQDLNEKLNKNNSQIIDQIMANGQETLDVEKETNNIRRQNRIKDLDDLIKLEEESNNTNLTNIGKYLEEKYALEHFGLDKSNADYKQFLYEKNKLLLELEVKNQNIQIQGAIDTSNLLLSKEKENSTKSFELKRQIAADQYEKDKNDALIAEKEKENKLLEAQAKYNNTIKQLTLDENKVKKQFAEEELNIAINAIKDETDKSIEIREAKFQKDKDDLLDNVRFQELTLKQQNELLLELEQQRNNDIDKIYRERAEKEQELQNKLTQISNDTIKNRYAKEKADRDLKYKQDLEALNKSLLGSNVTQQQADKARADLKKVKDDEDRKTDEEAALAKLTAQINHDQKGLAFYTKYWAERRELITEQEQEEIDNSDGTEEAKTQIQKQFADERKKLLNEEVKQFVGYGMQILGAAGDVLGQMSQLNQLQEQSELSRAQYNAVQQDQIKRKYFEKNKQGQIAETIISTLQSAVNAYESLAEIPVVGPALGAAAAAVALVFGYDKVNAIRNTQYESSLTSASNSPGKNYAEGGLIQGPNHAQGGVNINAQGGEAVMTQNAVTMFRPMLSVMNQMGGGTSFTKGIAGQANYDNPKTQDVNNTTITKTYVVESDLTSIQQRNARLKSLSTI